MEAEMIKLTLPDGSVREYEGTVSAYDVAKSISEGLARSVVGAVYNGRTIGLKEEIDQDGTRKESIFSGILHLIFWLTPLRGCGRMQSWQ